MKPARVVGYIRVSTSDQADHGHSLEAQRERLASYASLYELELVAVEVDAGASAKSLKGRPGLEAALAMLPAGKADGLLVCKLDRLTRSLRDLSDLIDRYFAPGKSALVSVAEQVDTRSASGRLVLNVLMSVAQWEREVISERTSEVLRSMRRAGKFTGGTVPYGFRLVAGELVEVEEEQRAIRAARRLRADQRSLRAIGQALVAKGMLPRTGRKTWHPEQVRSLLKTW